MSSIIDITLMLSEQLDFLLRGLPGTHDPNGIVLGFGVNHDDEARTGGAEGDETILFV